LTVLSSLSVYAMLDEVACAHQQMRLLSDLRIANLLAIIDVPMITPCHDTASEAEWAMANEVPREEVTKHAAATEPV